MPITLFNALAAVIRRATDISAGSWSLGCNPAWPRGVMNDLESTEHKQ